MELNLIATGIELLGASVAKLTVDNTIVDIENDAQNGTKEYLATNLFDSTITQSMFQELYFYRWPVELKYKELKSRLAIEEFSGATTTSVLVRHFLNPLMNSIANFFPLNAWKLNIILSSPTTIVQQIHIII